MLEIFLCVIVVYLFFDVLKGEVIDFMVEFFIFIIVIIESLDSVICDKVLECDVVDYIFKENL